ncbi:hypothetical protein L7F22_016009 [Adiantum nelumboides]|nr:hypothetical protein [Adiantum nelumboides]
MTSHIYEKELLAVIHALTQWRHYLLGADFTGHKNVVADALSQKPLVLAISAIHHRSFEDMVDLYATDIDFADVFTRIWDRETVAGYSIRDGYLMRKTMLCVTQPLREKAKPKVTLFTGSSRIAEILAEDLRGRVKLEDAGFDWKILGPDVQEEDYVAWVCDQDAYACSGQKCSAQSILFMHENWGTGFVDKLKNLAKRRKLDDLTIGPVLTVTTDQFLEHICKLLKIPGAKLLFGGKSLENHSIPKVYGAVEPTAVFVPLTEMLKEDEYFELVTTEIFGPLQVITEYKSEELSLVLDACEGMKAHLTAAVVSNDLKFLQEVLGKTVNGTTYAGIRARTTGAPQNHWFGPAGDPRGAGIGTPEAIRHVWSCHREIIQDIGPVSKSWALPPPS